MSGAPAQLEVERSVRDLLYGERVEVRATRAPGPALRTPDLPRATPRPDPRVAGVPGRLIGDRYRLLERVGVGGMATVYRARDERLKREVAVKLIAERLAREPLVVRRFRREAQLCAGLAHPNIVAVLDAGVEPQDFIVMELVLGVDARTLLREQGRLTPGEAVHVVAQACEALAYAHGDGVVHNDVSPRNILIRRRDLAAKLADFGLAAGALDLPASRGSDVTGTPGHVAPELLSGAEPSPRSDLYSLGMVAYRLLAGPSAMRSGDPGATAPVASAAPNLPPLADIRSGLPRGLSEAIAQAMAHDPDERQDSVAEFHAELVDGLSAPRELPSAA